MEMHRRHAVALLAALPIGGYAQSLSSIASALKDPLLNVLTSQLGVTEKQAKGGVGSYLTLLKEKLPKRDFNKIASLVPGASGYLESARKLGAVVGPLKNLAGLTGALGKLGMTPATAAEFTPTMTDYLGKLGGSNVQSLLAVALK
jgi:hypothetical protein